MGSSAELYTRAISDGGAPEGVERRTIQTEGHQRGSSAEPPSAGLYMRAISDGGAPEGIERGTIHESHFRRRGTRGGRAQNHT